MRYLNINCLLPTSILVTIDADFAEKQQGGVSYLLRGSFLTITMLGEVVPHSPKRLVHSDCPFYNDDFNRFTLIATGSVSPANQDFETRQMHNCTQKKV